VIGDEYDGVPMPLPAGVRRERLLVEHVRLIMPADHPLARRRRVPMVQLRDTAWAAGQPGTSHRQVLVRTCRTLGGFEPDLRHRSNDLLVLLAFVRDAGAIVLLPELVGAERDPTVAVRPIAEGEVRRTVWAITREGTAGRPALAAVLGALRDAAASHGARQR
jgi:DNA-binding transcriptional LysR family regulator